VASSRFRFGAFTVSPAHRYLRQDGRDVPLIPRYFDLLVLLITERHRVVTRQEIFERVWADVVVSDGALTQAIRTIRRSLDDDSREPRFVRTVSRHGYQFVSEIREEPDDGSFAPTVVAAAEPAVAEPAAVAAIDQLVERLTGEHPFEAATDEERREAAEELHAIGTGRALDAIDGRPGHAEARAILRDARWDVPSAGPVGLLDSPAPIASIYHLVRLRLRRAARHTSNRWASAAIGGTAAGILAGAVGGFALWLVPASDARPDVVLALALVGALAGALGAAGIGAGLAAAEALARSARALALAACGATGGLIAGSLAQAVALALVSGMFGRDLPDIGGAFEGLVLGAAAGLGYAWSTRRLPGGGLAAPRGTARARAAMATGATVAAAAVALSLGGWHLVGSSLDVTATLFEGSDVGLGPLGALLGEESLRPVTRTVVSAFEGLLFGIGLAFGLTHRPKRKEI
jgi:DNA-binding winged helix-turn-helix (wHTH) protein